MRLVVVLGAQGTQVAQHQPQIRAIVDAMDMVDPCVAFTLHAATAHGTAVAVPYEDKATNSDPLRPVVEATGSAKLSHM